MGFFFIIRRVFNMNKRINYGHISRFARDEQGQALVIMALAVIVLIGIVAATVDIGYARDQKINLQKSADAAALAGARELVDGVDVYDAVLDNILAQGLSESDIINKVDIQNLDPDSDVQVKVELNTDRELFFFKALGIGSAKIEASSTAGYYPVEGLGGLLPFGLPENIVDDMEASGTNGMIVYQKDNQDWTGGNYGFVNLENDSGSPSSLLGEWTTNGYPGVINVLDHIKTVPGAGLNSTHFDAIPIYIDNGTLLYVPIIREIPPGDGNYDPNEEVEVAGFAQIIFTKLEGHGSGIKLYAEYQNPPGKLFVPGVAGDETTEDTGIYSISLIQ